MSYHSDGTSFSDGTGYAPTDPLKFDDWPDNPGALSPEHTVSLVALALLKVIEGHRPTKAMRRFLRTVATGTAV